MIKRIGALIAITLAALPVFAEDTGPKDAQGRRIVTVWGLTISPSEKGQDLVVREFERRNPDLKVRLLKMGAGDMNPQKLLTAIAGGKPPDAIRQDRFAISDWAGRGAFQPLDELIARDINDPLSPKAEQYYEAPWREASYQGRVYGIPTGADNRILYWNKTVFAKHADELIAAGLDPNRAPRTWSETLAYSRVLTKFNNRGELTQAGFMPNYGNSWLYMYAFQMNASFMSEDGKTCTLYSPESETALQFMVDGYNILKGLESANKFSAGFRGNEFNPFFTGQIAMFISGDWEIRGMARWAPQLQLGAAPAPVPDDRYFRRGAFANEPDQFVTWAGGYSWAIPSGAKNREAGWRWIKWVTSTEGRLLAMKGQAEYERSEGRRFIPGVDSQIKTNQEAIRLFASGDSVFEQAFRMHVSLMPNARMRPPTFASQVLWNEHVRAADQAMRGILTPKQALTEGQITVQRHIDEVLMKEKFPVFDLRGPAYVTLAVIGVGIVAFFIWLKRLKLGRVAGQEAAAGFLFISPWVIGFLIFTLGPMISSFILSFTFYDVINEARWVGFYNYQSVFTGDSKLLVKSFMNVIYLGGIGIPLGIVTGLAIALLLNSGVRGMKYYRTAFYLPSITPAVAGVFLWQWILNPDSGKGLINSFWTSTITAWTAVPAPGWLSVEPWAKPALIVMGLWGAGGGMILWLAGLKGIPSTLYEAASIDGASPKQQLFSITLPQLSPLIFFNVVMGLIGVVQTFDGVYIITGGLNYGPNDALAMPVYILFQNAFNFFRMGYASALAWIIFLIILTLTLVQFKLAPRWVHTEVDKK
ncbi:MAG: extracellular solute-binding protein [Fimbriimonadaceae bacterium]|jgi:multiple sugar transport system permease protein|nr:extracellular solute-binding protein [Fimbriimonadaceae bacterium]